MQNAQDYHNSGYKIVIISRFVYKWLKIYMVKCIFDIMTIFETAKLNHHYMKTILDHRWAKLFTNENSTVRKSKFV